MFQLLITKVISKFNLFRIHVFDFLHPNCLVFHINFYLIIFNRSPAAKWSFQWNFLVGKWLREVQLLQVTYRFFSVFQSRFSVYFVIIFRVSFSDRRFYRNDHFKRFNHSSSNPDNIWTTQKILLLFLLNLHENHNELIGIFFFYLNLI